MLDWFRVVDLVDDGEGSDRSGLVRTVLCNLLAEDLVLGFEVLVVDLELFKGGHERGVCGNAVLESAFQLVDAHDEVAVGGHGFRRLKWAECDMVGGVK